MPKRKSETRYSEIESLWLSPDFPMRIEDGMFLFFDFMGKEHLLRLLLYILQLINDICNLVEKAVIHFLIMIHYTHPEYSLGQIVHIVNGQIVLKYNAFGDHNEIENP